jgi:hypothetical protein
MLSEKMGRAAIYCYERPALRWIGLLLATAHKRYHAGLVDKRAAREQSSKALGWWWLSFVDAGKPDGQRFLGVAIVEGHGVASAATRAHELGVNPGGEVRGLELTGDGIPPLDMRNRLLAKAELEEADLI